MIKIDSRVLLFSAMLSTVLTFAGWAGLHLLPQRESLHWIIVPTGLLTFPGGIFVTFIAAFFSPQGFHGTDQFAWLIPPVNWLFYLLIFFVIFDRRKRSQTQ